MLSIYKPMYTHKIYTADPWLQYSYNIRIYFGLEQYLDMLEVK